MERLALILATVSLVGAVICAVGVGLARLPLPTWILFVMQAVTLAACFLSIRRTRTLGIRNFASGVPNAARWLLPGLALLGILLMAKSLIASMPDRAPSGRAVHAYSANIEAGRCRVLYNKEEAAIEPIDNCFRFQRVVTLAFTGGWILFSSIAAWLSFLTSAFSARARKAA